MMEQRDNAGDLAGGWGVKEITINYFYISLCYHSNSEVMSFLNEYGDFPKS
jgi:hypothetical protein